MASSEGYAFLNGLRTDTETAFLTCETLLMLLNGRRLYKIKGPNYSAAYRIDSYDKLSLFGLCVKGCIWLLNGSIVGKVIIALRVMRNP